MPTSSMRRLRWPQMASQDAQSQVRQQSVAHVESESSTNAKCSGLKTAAFPLFGVQMYEKLGYEWATSLLAFLTVAMMPFPWLFFKYGKNLRRRSRFAVRTK